MIFLIMPGVLQAAGNASTFLQLVDYIGVDYPEAVHDGKIINPAEYGEMQEFAATALQQARDLQADAPGARLIGPASTLQELVRDLAPAERVAAVTARLRTEVMQHFDLRVVPRSQPDLARARTLYAENCAACHGLDGQGDGPLAARLEPAPTDFHDLARYRERTLFGLYNTITLGVADTAMQGYASQLNEDDRWALAFLVGQLAVTPDMQEKGAALWSRDEKPFAADPKTLTTLSPAEAAQRFGSDAANLLAYLRRHPDKIFGKTRPLPFAREQITKSLEFYEQGRGEQAYRHALSAYLDGFELIEHGLDAVNPELRREIETAMTSYREGIKRGISVSEIQMQAHSVIAMLDRAADSLQSRTLSGSAAFAGAFVILLREGLEALLVVAALLAFLLKTGRRDGLPYLHFGWISALVLGGVTWFVSQHVIVLSGASREITEGVAALIAMGVLFYVGFWLHSKTHALQWKQFIEGSVNKALTTGTLWALAGLSFIAVYREVFETILFYQAMWVQADTSGQGMMLGGMGSAAAALLVLAWLILRYSTRLPLRQFFAWTSVFMFLLAVVFAGKGIAALQEAGKLPVEPVSFPRIDVLGVYPSLEGLLLQGLLLTLAAIIMLDLRGKWRTVAAQRP